MMDLINAHSERTEICMLDWISTNGFMGLNENYFYCTETLAIYRIFREQFKKYGNIEANALTVDQISILSRAIDYVVPKHPKPLVAEIKALYELRELAKALNRSTKEMSIENYSDIATELSKKITGILTNKNVIKYNHAKNVYEFLEYIRDMKENGRQMLGISSGLEKIDTMLNGWQKGNTYIVGGLEKLGKSRFCAHVSNQWLLHGIGGIWFSMEMSEEDIHSCNLGNRSSVDTALIGTSRIESDQLNAVLKCSEKYMQEPLHIDTSSSISTEHIRNVIRNQKIIMQQKGFNVVWVIVDYIQRMCGANNKAQELEQVASELADIARDEKVIMVVISQLSADAERNKDLSPYQFIKGSKGIREAADGILVLYKDKFDIEKNNNNSNNFTESQIKYMSAYIVQRRGISNEVVKLSGQLQYSRFSEE